MYPCMVLLQGTILNLPKKLIRRETLIFGSCVVLSLVFTLFLHGGGWVTENIDTYTEVCINLANFTGCKVIAVEYGLAPEHPFPEGLEDCYSAAKAVITDPSVVGVDADEIVLAGDSAGGNLAAAVSLMARDKGEFKVSRQILIYPAVNNDYSENSKYRSVIENGTDYILTAKRISEYVSLYATCEEDMQNHLLPSLAKRNCLSVLMLFINLPLQ